MIITDRLLKGAVLNLLYTHPQAVNPTYEGGCCNLVIDSVTGERKRCLISQAVYALSGLEIGEYHDRVFSATVSYYQEDWQTDGIDVEITSYAARLGDIIQRLADDGCEWGWLLGEVESMATIEDLGSL